MLVADDTVVVLTATENKVYELYETTIILANYPAQRAFELCRNAAANLELDLSQPFWDWLRTTGRLSAPLAV